MKVIKEGKRKPQKHEGLWYCSDCGRVVEMERGDDHLVKRFHDAQDIRDDTYMGMECPVCSAVTNWYRERKAI